MTLPRTPVPGEARLETGVGVLDRCVQVLRAVDRGARTVTQVVEETGLTKTTAFRLLKALETHGLVGHEAGVGYRLGPLLYRLGTRATAELPLADVGRPVLERLTASTGESSQLYVRLDDDRICVAAVESPSELRTIVSVGAELPLTRGSAGKVLLAWGPPGDWRRLSGDVDDPDRFEQQLVTARRRGWAQSAEEREPGVGSVSAPVRGPTGDVVAAVSVSGPVGRMRDALARRYAPAVVAAASEIERALGAGHGIDA
jgi:DNA-binding IclR family transcriptional regulator